VVKGEADSGQCEAAQGAAAEDLSCLELWWPFISAVGIEGCSHLAHWPEDESTLEHAQCNLQLGWICLHWSENRSNRFVGLFASYYLFPSHSGAVFRALHVLNCLSHTLIL
jgi:hypothetical protein